ncbi:hypothetical protein MNBD_ALPHA11-146 [hydrothermal vent metagenome]|uniref:Uncharacterized protein n=1 Tax=hydrothermal vent metagenome TaxID=652676 RepID=A0A3B0TP37_9ZZZZ
MGFFDKLIQAEQKNTLNFQWLRLHTEELITISNRIFLANQSDQTKKIEHYFTFFR